MIHRIASLLLPLACSGCMASSTDRTPTVTNAWLRPARLGEMVSIYFTIHNPTAVPLVLTHVAVDGIPHSTFHETSMANGMSRMADRDTLVVPADDSVVLAPLRLHVMGHGVPRTLTAGDSLIVRLTGRDSVSLTTTAIVAVQ